MDLVPVSYAQLNYSRKLKLHVLLKLCGSSSVGHLAAEMDDAGRTEAERSAMKVQQISVGESHNLVLTGDGFVYAWGKGMFGRLGTGSVTDELLPVKVPIKMDGREKENPSGNTNFDNVKQHQDMKITAIAAGAYHNLALSDEGSVWSWGYNVYGQLGREDETTSVPCLVDDILEDGSIGTSMYDINTGKGKRALEAVDVKAGGMMSLAIDKHGTLWIWGRCPQSTSENRDETFRLSFISSPQPVGGFQGHSVSKVACGNEHVLALVTDGTTVAEEHLICYAWGSNKHGQLGLGDKESRLVPQPVNFNHTSAGLPYHIACGAFHTAVLTSVQLQAGIDTGLEEASQLSHNCSNGRASICWTFGHGENGQLGHGTTQSKLLPEPVDGLPKSSFLKLVECGLFHTCVISDLSDVWIWGMERGLGLCPNIGAPGIGAGDALSPLKIVGEGSEGPVFFGSTGVGCGAAHTVAVTDNGFKLWAWGRGQNGVLGRGNTLDSLVPCLVSWPPPSCVDILDLNNGPKQGDEQMIEMKMEDGMDKNGHAYFDKLRLLGMEKRLSSAAEEVQFLRARLDTAERYANILHFSIFGNCERGHTIMQMLQGSNTIDIQEEWGKSMELATPDELIQMEAFYRSMRTKVKDVIMQKKIKEWTRQCWSSFNSSSVNDKA